jgi:pimeloyl-ACP methyl ester carboxylesterase
MYFKTADVAGLGLFYREAGDPSKPSIVLLHGFPSSSYQFHDLIPLLADCFHVIAPDYPGMGFSEVPTPAVLRPTFDEVARVIDTFLAERAPGPLILYMHARPPPRRPGRLSQESGFSALRHGSSTMGCPVWDICKPSNGNPHQGFTPVEHKS